MSASIPPSPTSAGGPSSTGIRRPNRVPLYVIIAVCLLFVFGFAYSFYERMQTLPTKTAAEAKHPPQAGDGSALADELSRRSAYRVPGTIPTDRKIEPDAAPVDKRSGPTDTKQADRKDVVAEARAAAWKTYFDQTAEVAKQRYDREREALSGDGNATASGTLSGTGGTGGAVNEGGQDVSNAVALAGASAGGAGTGHGGVGGTDPNAQSEKQRFLDQQGDTLGLNEDLVAFKHPAKPNTIMEGTPIPATTVVGSTSDMPGMVTASVDETIYDHMTGKVPLIPQTSRLIGKIDNVVSAGQERQGVVWQRIEFPDTSSIQLGSMEGADQAGYAGEHDQVDTHWASKFLSATVIAIGGAAAQLAQPQQSAFSGYSPSSVAAGSLTNQYSQLGQAYAQQGMSIPNTLTILPGYRLVVMVSKDIHLPPYVDQRTQGTSLGPIYR